mgnify:CR=1 FL=1
MRKALKIDAYSDVRGEIFINKIKGVEFIVSFTKAGVYRGGDYHASKQYAIILKGKFEITLRQNNKEAVKKYGPNELIVVPANTPHLFKALTDVLSIEWKAGAGKPRYYQPYRKIINQDLE